MRKSNTVYSSTVVAPLYIGPPPVSRSKSGHIEPRGSPYAHTFSWYSICIVGTPYATAAQTHTMSTILLLIIIIILLLPPRRVVRLADTRGREAAGLLRLADHAHRHLVRSGGVRARVPGDAVFGLHRLAAARSLPGLGRREVGPPWQAPEQKKAVFVYVISVVVAKSMSERRASHQCVSK